MNDLIGLENLNVIASLKAAYAFDDGASLWHNADQTSLGFGLIHYAFLRNLRPDFALAIGSRYGFIPACLALALKANGKGRLHFVDANYNDQTDHYAKAYGGSGHWSRPIHELFETLELYKWIDLFLERTDTFFPRNTTRYGYIYIDGNHSYEGIAYDLEQSVQHLIPGGIITMHDALVDKSYGATLTDPGEFGIKDYLSKRFPQAVVLGRWPGLAMVQTQWPATEAVGGLQQGSANSKEGETLLSSQQGSANPSQPGSHIDLGEATKQRVQQLESVVKGNAAENEKFRQQLAIQEERIHTLTAQIHSLKGLENGLTSALAEMRERLSQQDAYYELIARVRNLVHNKLPPNAKVLVVSRGDDQLISFGTQHGLHFPQNDAGLYAGEHPGDSAQAIAALERMRGRGAQYILFPKTALWWLESYPEFGDYLRNKFRLLFKSEDTGVLFALDPAI